MLPSNLQLVNDAAIRLKNFEPRIGYDPAALSNYWMCEGCCRNITVSGYHRLSEALNQLEPTCLHMREGTIRDRLVFVFGNTSTMEDSPFMHLAEDQIDRIRQIAIHAFNTRARAFRECGVSLYRTE